MKPRAVYFARCFAECGVDMQAIKIGCTDDIDRRLSTVHTLLPFRCEFITAVPHTGGGMIASSFQAVNGGRG